METQLQGVVPPLPGLTAARTVNGVFLETLSLPSSVAETDPKLSHGSTQGTALQETEEDEEGLPKEPEFCSPSSFCSVSTFFAAFPPLPQKLSSLQNNFVIFLTLRSWVLIALFYAFLVVPKCSPCKKQ